jgi:hypothetical protein
VSIASRIVEWLKALVFNKSHPHRILFDGKNVEDVLEFIINHCYTDYAPSYHCPEGYISFGHNRLEEGQTLYVSKRGWATIVYPCDLHLFEGMK